MHSGFRPDTYSETNLFALSSALPRFERLTARTGMVHDLVRRLVLDGYESSEVPEWLARAARGEMYRDPLDGRWYIGSIADSG
jgi:hypothetical protein